MMPSRCCTQYVSKSGRPSSSHRTGKGQSSSQFPRRVVPKHALTIGQLHSSPMLVRSRLKYCMLAFSILWIKNLQLSKLGLEKEEEPETKLPTSAGSWKKQESSRKNIYFCFIDYAKAFVWITINCGKFWKRWEYQTTWPAHRMVGRTRVES